MQSTAARLMTSLIDRCASQLRTAPRNVEDWAVAAAGSWVTCLDNVSDIQDWLQDAICRAVTGDGLLRRQLYTDSDVSVLAFRRVVAITSVDPGTLNGDLADRMVTVELERIKDDARAPEEDLRIQWHKTHPVALAGLLDITVKVLKLLPTIRRSGLPRMADFARVLLAVDEVLGSSGYDTYAAQADSTAEQVAESDAVIVAIRTFVTKPWEGTASELLALLTPEKAPKGWPETPQGMGGKLMRAAPSLRSLGWTVERPPRVGHKGSRRWSLTPPAEETPAGLSAMSDMSADPADQDEPADNLDDRGLFADDPHVSDPWIGDDVSAGGDVADIADMSAGTSSNATVWTEPEANLGPCVRCQALCIRYGDNGNPLCPDCRGAS